MNPAEIQMIMTLVQQGLPLLQQIVEMIVMIGEQIQAAQTSTPAAVPGLVALQAKPVAMLSTIISAAQTATAK